VYTLLAISELPGYIQVHETEETVHQYVCSCARCTILTWRSSNSLLYFSEQR